MSRPPNQRADRRRAIAALSTLAAAPLLMSECGPWAAAYRQADRPRMGINIAGPVYWNTELPFVDLMRMAGDWSLRRADGGEARGAIPELDGDGWLRHLPVGHVAATPVAAAAHLPHGAWTVLYDGRGRIELDGGLKVVHALAGRLECEAVRPTPGSDPLLWLRVMECDATDPVRRIRVLMPGHEASHDRDPWNPRFVERWRGWACLRFMDFMNTNGSTLARWSERPLASHRSFAPHGVPAELLIDLANRCSASPWFCMPHQADDDFVAAFAQLVRARLDPGLEVYVEHSNEVWNAGFEQARQANATGMARGLSSQPWSAGLRYHALRSREIFRLWSAAFGASDRLVRVLSTQSGNLWATREILDTQAWRDADALGVTGYLGLVPTPSSTPAAADVARWSLDDVFAELARTLSVLEDLQRQQRAICTKHGLRMVAYEGGQHLVAGGGAERDTVLTALLQTANRDPRMGAIYRALYDQWEAVHGDLFCHYASVVAPSPWGSWGLLEHHDDDESRRPKYVETRRRAGLWNRAMVHNVHS